MQDFRPLALLVDDSDIARELVADALRNEGFVVRTKITAIGVRALIRRLRPSIVIVDWRMPIMDGVSLCRAIREDVTVCEIPVLLYSSTDLSELGHAARDCGATAWAMKTEPKAIAWCAAEIVRGR